jgi:hypothetical protein
MSVDCVTFSMPAGVGITTATEPSPTRVSTTVLHGLGGSAAMALRDERCKSWRRSKAAKALGCCKLLGCLQPETRRSQAHVAGFSRRGVFFLLDKLVYVGQGWNCFLSVAEQTRKDLDRRFTRWAFVEVGDEAKRKAMVKELKRLHVPRDNNA